MIVIIGIVCYNNKQFLECLIGTRAYVKPRAPGRKGVKYGCNSFITLAPSWQQACKGNSLSIIIVQAVKAAVM